MCAELRITSIIVVDVVHVVVYDLCINLIKIVVIMCKTSITNIIIVSIIIIGIAVVVRMDIWDIVSRLDERRSRFFRSPESADKSPSRSHLTQSSFRSPTSGDFLSGASHVNQMEHYPFPFLRLRQV